MHLQDFKNTVLPMLEAIFESQNKVGPSETVAGLWFAAVGRYDAGVVMKALSAYVARPERTFGIVQPNDIVLLIEGTPEERAAAAWHKFFAAVRDKSPYLSITFDDPFIHATVKYMGGWVKVTQEMEDTARDRDRARRVFEDNYQQFLRGGLPADTPLRLPGVVENHRILNGLPYEEPVQLVGDQTTAKLVQSGTHPALPARRPALPTVREHGAA